MEKQQIQALRSSMGLTQPQFAQLFGVHTMTVWKWEQGDGPGPNAYQLALMHAFQKTEDDKRLHKNVKAALVGAGVVAALLLLLKASEGK